MVGACAPMRTSQAPSLTLRHQRNGGRNWVLKLTAEQVRTLAPDASAARAAEGLADKRRWSGTGRTESAAWGLCQGSGSSPYQTAVDLSGPAYKCSCPSRKVPCKHALGLLFLLAGDAIAQAKAPDWVATWL